MSGRINSITQERVKHLFNYHEDGYLIWNITPGGGTYKGDIPSCINSTGYVVTTADRVVYLVHRLIFLWHHGYLPEGIVDHKDRIKTHNWIDNLREISHSCNLRNCNISKNNTSGITGVSFEKKSGKFSSRIYHNKRLLFLGEFKEFNDAVKARYNKEVELNWSVCNRTSTSFLYLKENNLI